MSETPPIRYKRSVKLIKPSLQLKLVAMFLGVSTTSLLLQYLLFASRLSDVATGLPDGGAALVAAMPSLLMEVLALSFAFLFPVMMCIGILATFRIAGPVYRFERYLEQIARGDQVGPCRIRRGDELWDLCDRINEATAPLRHPKLVEDDDEGTKGPQEPPLRRAS
jgi:hypothetical protein